MATAIVTGSNRGIGLEFCKQLKEAGFDVIAACRKASDELKALGVRVEEKVDVSKKSDVHALADRLQGLKIDLVVNNAGIAKTVSLDQFDVDAIRDQFEVNSIAPLQFSVAMLPLLKEGSKIAIVTSRMGSIADNDSGASYGYRMSKTAVNMGGKSLSIDLKPKGISVALLHPGYVKTDMTNQSGQLSPQESVKGMMKVISELKPENSGSFWHTNGDTLPW